MCSAVLRLAHSAKAHMYKSHGDVEACSLGWRIVCKLRTAGKGMWRCDLEARAPNGDTIRSFKKLQAYLSDSSQRAFPSARASSAAPRRRRRRRPVQQTDDKLWGGAALGDVRKRRASTGHSDERAIWRWRRAIRLVLFMMRCIRFRFAMTCTGMWDKKGLVYVNGVARPDLETACVRLKRMRHTIAAADDVLWGGCAAIRSISRSEDGDIAPPAANATAEERAWEWLDLEASMGQRVSTSVLLESRI